MTFNIRVALDDFNNTEEADRKLFDYAMLHLAFLTNLPAQFSHGDGIALFEVPEPKLLHFELFIYIATPYVVERVGA